MAPLTASRFAAHGALAGAMSALLFTVAHHVVIGPIWFALPAMLAAGAICGSSLAGTYLLVARSASADGWLRFNLFFLGMFVALGAVSNFFFEPVTTIAALLRTNQPPVALIARALPMTAGFAVSTALLLVGIYRPRWVGVLALSGTTFLLLTLLGLNISMLGLVDVTTGEVRLLVETAGLLVGLAGANAGIALVPKPRLGARSA